MNEIVDKKVLFKGYSTLTQITVQNKKLESSFKREVLERGNSVTLLVYDSKNKIILLTHEFRAGEYLDNVESTGLVAGMMDANESPKVCAIRELKEESGISVNESDIHHFNTCYTSPGITTEKSYLCFVDTDLTEVDTESRYGVEGECESIRLSTIKYEELNNLIREKVLSSSSLLLIHSLMTNTLNI